LVTARLIPGTHAQNVRCVADEEQFPPARTDGVGLADGLLPPPLGVLLLVLPLLLQAASRVMAAAPTSPV
jgi:hypothetical protein